MLISEVDKAIRKVKENILSKEECDKAITYLLELRMITKEPISEKERLLTDYFINKFIINKEG